MRKNAPHAASFRVFGHFRPRMTYIRNEHTFLQKRNQCITTRRANAIPKKGNGLVGCARNRKRGKEYDEESVSIHDELLAIARSPVKDGKLKGYFDLIANRRDRFFQWVCNPEVEAENNLAERRLRPLVIARRRPGREAVAGPRCHWAQQKDGRL